MKIGVLAAQGAFAEHIAVLTQTGSRSCARPFARELDGLDGLIIPGGESTTISRLMHDYDLTDEIKELAKSGLPIFGTCAGMILLAKKICRRRWREPLGLMDITVKRNAFGRQRESFETELAIPVLGEKPFPAVFIRAPLIEQVERQVRGAGQLGRRHDRCRQAGKLLVSAFHPELTDDLGFTSIFWILLPGSR